MPRAVPLFRFNGMHALMGLHRQQLACGPWEASMHAARVQLVLLVSAFASSLLAAAYSGWELDRRLDRCSCDRPSLLFRAYIALLALMCAWMCQ